MKTPEVPGRWGAQLIYALLVPLFFLAFVLVFNPYDMFTFYDMGMGRFTLNILMLFCISLVCMGLTRTAFYMVMRFTKVKMSWFWYVVWCLAEVMVISQFHTLYSSLMLHTWYLSALDDCVKFNYTILVFPYVIITLSLLVNELRNDQADGSASDESLLRFHDENQKLKLVIAAPAVLYLQSEENYVRIHYLESGKLKNYVLRNSMKSLEDNLAAHGLVRCHRSYVINSKHVKVLKKEAEGVILAQLDVDGTAQIPVSKRYYDQISALLS